MLRSHHKLDVIVRQLTHCDYIVSNRMAVERRTYSGLFIFTTMSRHISVTCGTRRLRWYGHVQRATSCINSITHLGLPGTRDRGRPRKTWSSCVRNDMTICNLDGVNPLDTGCLQLLEILEISWNLKTLLEISWNLNGLPGNFRVMIDRIGIRS